MNEESRTQSEKAVRNLYRELRDGWNRGSGDAFVATFREDGHLVGFDGTHFKGRDEIAPFHQELFEKWLKGTRLVGQVDNIQFPSTDVAVLHAYGGTIEQGKSEPSPDGTRFRHSSRRNETGSGASQRSKTLDSVR